MRPARAGLIAKAFAIPVLLHGLYDLPLLAGLHSVLGMLVVGAMVIAVLTTEGVWALLLARGLRRAQLAAVAAGEPVVAAVAPLSPTGRWGAWVALVSGLIVTSVGGLRVTGVLVLVFEVDLALEIALLQLALATPAVILGVLLFGLGISRLNSSGRTDANSKVDSTQRPT